MVFGACYIAKPSTNNAYSSAILMFTCWFGDFTGIQVFAIAQLYLLFTQMRDPSYRYLIAIIALVTGILGFTHTSQLVNLSGLKSVTANGGGGSSGGGSGGSGGGTLY